MSKRPYFGFALLQLCLAALTIFFSLVAGFGWEYLISALFAFVTGLISIIPAIFGRTIIPWLSGLGSLVLVVVFLTILVQLSPVFRSGRIPEETLMLVLYGTPLLIALSHVIYIGLYINSRKREV